MKRFENPREAKVATSAHIDRSTQPCPKLLRIAGTVENGQNRKCFAFDGKINIVLGEPPQTNPPGPFANFRESVGIGLRALQSSLEIHHKLSPKTWALFFVPCRSLGELQACFGSKNNPEAHFRPKRSLSSALTCSQGMPSCGLASKSARRRSSSAFCWGVKSGSYPSSTMISQKSCASLIRSSGGSALAASRISRALMRQTLAPSPRFGNPHTSAHFPP
jgi:hypothetical protein